MRMIEMGLIQLRLKLGVINLPVLTVILYSVSF